MSLNRTRRLRHRRRLRNRQKQRTQARRRRRQRRLPQSHRIAGAAGRRRNRRCRRRSHRPRRRRPRTRPDAGRRRSGLVDQWGRIDIVVANAGVNGVWASLEDLTVEEWDTTLDINLKGSVPHTEVHPAVPQETGRLRHRRRLRPRHAHLQFSRRHSLWLLEGRPTRLHQDDGPGTCAAQGARQLHLPRLDRNRDQATTRTAAACENVGYPVEYPPALSR